MSESYSVGIELDVDLRSVYRRLASRLRLILAGTAEADGVRLPAVPAVPAVPAPVGCALLIRHIVLHQHGRRQFNNAA